MEALFPKKIYIFVYGTLMQGQTNHGSMQGAEFVDHGITMKKYHLMYNGIPMVGLKQKVSCIHGDLFMVDKKQLKMIDALQGHPSLFKRKKVKVQTQISKYQKQCWMYFACSSTNTTGVTIKHGNYRKFLRQKPKTETSPTRRGWGKKKIHLFDY